MSEIPPPTIPPATPPPPGGGSYTPPPPPPPYSGGPGAGPGGTAGGGDRTLMLVLSYAWLASLIPLFTKRDDAEIQWHAKNGLVLAVAITVIQIFFTVFGYYFPWIGCLVSIVPCALGVGYVVVVIIAMIKAINGQRLRVPMLTDQAEKLNI